MIAVDEVHVGETRKRFKHDRIPWGDSSKENGLRGVVLAESRLQLPRYGPTRIFSSVTPDEYLAEQITGNAAGIAIEEFTRQWQRDFHSGTW